MTQFMRIDTKEKVRVVSDEGNFLTLNNGMKIDKQLFAQKYAPVTEGGNGSSLNPEDFLNQKTNIQVNPQKNNNIQLNENESIISPSGSVDPIDFLNSTNFGGVDGVDNIKKIDTTKHLEVREEDRHQIRNVGVEEGTIQRAQSLEEQRNELLAKHNSLNPNTTEYVDENDPQAMEKMMNGMKKPEKQTILNENGLTEHQEIMRQQHMELKGEDPYAEKIKKYRMSKGMSAAPVKNPTTPTQQTQQAVAQPVPVAQDPTTALFKKFKRNHKLSIKLNIKDKISKPDFIKVMADGLEGDIIQFYSDEIFNSFIENIDDIKKDIYNQIYKNVYGCLPEEDEIDDDLGTDPVDPTDDFFMIPGKKTKTGSLTFKYINDKGKVVDMIPSNAEKKGYKPATKKDIK